MSTLTRTQPGSLPLVLLRHLGALAVAAALVVGAGQVGPIGDQPVLWLAGAVVAGALAGLVDRGWLGLLFVTAGLVTGIALDLAAHHHATSEATVALATAAPLYLAVLLAGAAAYLIARIVRRQLG